jgi:hypothetical protein
MLWIDLLIPILMNGEDVCTMRVVSKRSLNVTGVESCEGGQSIELWRLRNSQLVVSDAAGLIILPEGKTSFSLTICPALE